MTELIALVLVGMAMTGFVGAAVWFALYNDGVL